MKEKSSKITKRNRISHKNIKRLFGPYLDGELDPKREKNLHDHLAECIACREALREEKALFLGLAGALETVEIPEKFNIVDSVAKEIESLDEKSGLRFLKKLFPSEGKQRLRPSFSLSYSPSFSYTVAIIIGISIGLLSGIFTPGASNNANYVQTNSSTTTSYLDSMIESISYTDEESLTNLYFGTETEDTNE